MARSPRITRFLVALAASVLAAGCGSSSSSNDSESDLDRIASTMSDVMCQSQAACNCMDASFVDDCKASYKDYLKLYMGVNLASTPGAKLDMEKFDACVAEARTKFATCPASGTFESPSCEGGPLFLIGTQAKGEPCADSESCAPGLSCEWTLGTCQDAAKETESCETISCATGLYCDGTAHCKKRGALTDSCTSNRQCQTGLVCNESSQCSNPLAQGAPCSSNDQCSANLYCSTTCLAMKAGGESCTSDDECLSDNCMDNDECEAANFCSMNIIVGK